MALQSAECLVWRIEGFREFTDDVGEVTQMALTFLFYV